MKAQHTPGPWHIGRTITGSEEDIQLSGLTGDGAKKYDCFVVAPAYTVAGVGGIGKEECRANARLIAAAPELLEACKQVRTMLDSMQKSQGVRIAWSSECFENSVGESLRALDSSISKATGQ